MIALVLGLLAGSAQAGDAVLDEAPATGRLYPRDLATDRATIRVEGTVTTPGFVRAGVMLRRDLGDWEEQAEDLVYGAGGAPFAFALEAEAGLYRYDVVAWLDDGGGVQVLLNAQHLAVGDAYLVNGQSNSVAGDYWSEGIANAPQSRWVRSYGSASLDPAVAAADTSWHVADGLLFNQGGTIGAWALRAARVLVEQHGVPVAVVHGGVGGTRIDQHARNDADPDDLGTIYGRLLHRAQAAGVAERARAMVWHQGESDGAGDPAVYLDRFQELRQAWLDDYPRLEQVFVFQVREGCGVPAGDMDIREAQRSLPDLHPHLTAIPTAGIDAHDGCHYTTAGYRTMSRWLVPAMSSALYGTPLPAGGRPPNLDHASFTTAVRDELALVFRDPHVLVVDPGAEARLVLDAPETVVGVTAEPGRLVLQLSGPTNATTVAYVGGSGPGPWIHNRRGVGAFTFEVPLQLP